MAGAVPVLLLPGVVLPAAEAYGALVEALGPAVDAHPKELELYATDAPPEGYELEAEVDGIRRAAAAWDVGRLHLVGYSGGGAAALAFTAAQPERVASLALLEPAWAGWQGMERRERETWDSLTAITGAPPDELLPAFTRAQLRSGVEPPPRSEGPTPPWMARRPAGIRALTRAFREGELDHAALARFERPVLYVLGGRSNPDLYELQARRLSRIFPDFTLEVFAERHHFDPPHRIEPGRLASLLVALWRRAPAAR